MRNGNWDLAWPLLGIPDPEERETQLLSPTERVAMTALAKEKKVLTDVAASVKRHGKNDNKKKEPGKAGEQDA